MSTDTFTAWAGTPHDSDAVELTALVLRPNIRVRLWVDDELHAVELPVEDARRLAIALGYQVKLVQERFPETA